MTIELHETQIEALEFLSDSVENGEEIVALVGAGGTGKSEILSRLLPIINRLDDKGEPIRSVFVTATTNPAAARLSEDIIGVTTVHSATAKPIFKDLYENIKHYYIGLSESSTEEDTKRFKSVYKFIPTALFFLERNHIDIDKFNNIESMLHSKGIGTFDPQIFDRYELNEKIYNSVIIIDEASMLPRESEYYNGSLVTIGLDAVQDTFDQVILVGDNHQLPPINGTSSFIDLEAYELTVNFRSEKDLLRAIQFAREGFNFYNFDNRVGENVSVVDSITDDWYSRTFMRDDVVHISYTNKTRRSIVKRVRKGQDRKPLDGECLRWRGKSGDAIIKGDVGKYSSESNAIEFDNSKQYINRSTMFDEYDTEHYARLQYKYSGTAHSSQGQSIPHVIVHLYDIPHFIDKETKRQWIYTAVSRASKSLTIIL